MASKFIKGNLKKISYLASFAIVIVIFLTVRYFVVAQITGQSIEISPPVQNIKADPGKPFTISTKVTNKSNIPLNLTVRIENFVPMGEEGQVQLISKGPYAISSYANLDKTNFTLGVGESENVTAEITLPNDAAGGRYGSFVFSITGNQKGNSASISQQLGSLFLIRISGPSNEKLALMEFSAPLFSESSPIPFSIKLKNAGNVHVTPYGLLNITNMFGQKTKDIVIQGTNIFPDSIRIIKTELKNQFLFGKYQANLTLYYGSEKNQVINPTLTFYVFPLRIFIAIVIVAIIIFLARKRLNKVLKAALGK